MVQANTAGEEEPLDKDHPDTHPTVYSMANVIMDQGKYHEALGWSGEHSPGKRSLGKDHLETLSAVYGMTSVFQSLGGFDEAMEWSRRARVGEEKSLGGEANAPFFHLNVNTDTNTHSNDLPKPNSEMQFRKNSISLLFAFWPSSPTSLPPSSDLLPNKVPLGHLCPDLDNQ